MGAGLAGGGSCSLLICEMREAGRRLHHLLLLGGLKVQ